MVRAPESPSCADTNDGVGVLKQVNQTAPVGRVDDCGYERSDDNEGGLTGNGAGSVAAFAHLNRKTGRSVPGVRPRIKFQIVEFGILLIESNNNFLVDGQFPICKSSCFRFG